MRAARSTLVLLLLLAGPGGSALAQDSSERGTRENNSERRTETGRRQESGVDRRLEAAINGLRADLKELEQFVQSGESAAAARRTADVQQLTDIRMALAGLAQRIDKAAGAPSPGAGRSAGGIARLAIVVVLVLAAVGGVGYWLRGLESRLGRALEQGRISKLDEARDLNQAATTLRQLSSTFDGRFAALTAQVTTSTTTLRDLLHTWQEQFLAELRAWRASAASDGPTRAHTEALAGGSPSPLTWPAPESPKRRPVLEREPVEDQPVALSSMVGPQVAAAVALLGEYAVAAPTLAPKVHQLTADLVSAHEVGETGRRGIARLTVEAFRALVVAGVPVETLIGGLAPRLEALGLAMKLPAVGTQADGSFERESLQESRRTAYGVAAERNLAQLERDGYSVDIDTVLLVLEPQIRRSGGSDSVIELGRLVIRG